MSYQTEDVNGIFTTRLTANDSTAQEKLGRVRELADGRKFRYVKMTGSAGALGRLLMPATKVAVTNAYSQNVTGPDGATTTQIVDDDAAYTPDAYVGWYYQTATAMTGSTEPIRIVGNSATALTLEKQIGTALTTSAVKTDDGEIIAGNVAGILSTASTKGMPIIGVCIGTITQDYYGWVQIAGPAAVWSDAITESINVGPGGDAAGKAVATDTYDDTVIGVNIAASGTAEYSLVNLALA